MSIGIRKNTLLKVVVLLTIGSTVAVPFFVLWLLRPRSHYLRAAMKTTAARVYLVGSRNGEIMLAVNHLKNDLGLEWFYHDKGWIKLNEVGQNYTNDGIIRSIVLRPDGPSVNGGIIIESARPLGPPYLTKGTPRLWHGIEFGQLNSPMEFVKYAIVPWQYVFMISLLPATGSLTRLAMIWRRKRKRIARIRANICPNCGYDLRASPNHCPECGSACKR